MFSKEYTSNFNLELELNHNSQLLLFMSESSQLVKSKRKTIFE